MVGLPCPIKPLADVMTMKPTCSSRAIDSAFEWSRYAIRRARNVEPRDSTLDKVYLTNFMKTKTAVSLICTVLLSATPLFAADAKANWDKHCAKCHGADGKGQTKMG